MVHRVGKKIMVTAKRRTRLLRTAFKYLAMFLFGTVGVILMVNLTWPSKPNQARRDIAMVFSDPEDNAISKSGSEDELKCKVPKLDPFSDVMKPFFSPKHKKFVCAGEPDWLWIGNGSVGFTDYALRTYPEIKCEIKYIQRTSDYANSIGKVKPLVSSSATFVRLDADFIRPYCTAQGGNKTWEIVMAGIHRNREVVRRSREKLSGTPPQQKINILMFGLDSMSRMSWIRHLPKTYKYLTEELKAMVMRQYNIVGDGTPQALIPILTGQTELELPEIRKNRPKATWVENVYPFIWNNFTDQGYTTIWGEDGSSVGTFEYRFKGFNRQPVDHYMRPYQLEYNKIWNRFTTYCMGSTPCFQVMTNWARQPFQIYPDVPKFVFGFHSELSHDESAYKLIGQIDEDFEGFLRNLKESGILDNTILVLMSDHGHRYAKLRELEQGKFEERLPLMSFVLPPWFESKFPIAYNNMKTNQQRLSTPFDLYNTWWTILNRLNQGMDVDSSVRQTGRSLSLFGEIPKSRGCQEANIELHWCTCLQWEPLDAESEKAKKVGSAIMDFINTLTADIRSKCVPLEVGQITRSKFLTPNKDFLKFKQTKDADGFVADLTGHTNPADEEYFSMQIVASPGGGLFEVSAKYNKKMDEFSIKETDVSRVNKYADHAKCIALTNPNQVKYCYCKS